MRTRVKQQYLRKLVPLAAGLPTGHKGYNMIGTWQLCKEDIELNQNNASYYHKFFSWKPSYSNDRLSTPVKMVVGQAPRFEKSMISKVLYREEFRSFDKASAEIGNWVET